MLERSFQEPKFRVCCLGAIKLVEAGSGTDMTPTSRKTRALLGYLCMVGKPVGRERLAALLWGDRGDEQARASLRQAIYELRSLLGGDRLLKVERDAVAVGDEVVTDVAAILEAAQSGDLEQLGQALSEWRGDFFEDLSSIDPSFDMWLQSERLRVQESLVGASTEAIKSGTERGEIAAARKIVSLLQQHDGTNEAVLRLGLRLDHLAGDSAALHRRYERFRETLKSELDATPAAESQLLFDELTRKSFPAKPLPAPRPTEVAADGKIDRVRQNDAVQMAAEAEADADARIAPPPTNIKSAVRLAAALIAIASVCAIAWLARSYFQPAPPPRPEPLLAVTPFQNLSDDPRSRALADGITQDVADAIRRSTHIRVAATTVDLRGANAPRTQAATHVLSGAVERTGNRMRVIVQLMDIPVDRVIWTHAYDGDATRALATGQDIAAQVAAALAKPAPPDVSGRFQPAESEAHSDYLRGRALYLQHQPGAAILELEESVRIAPNFADAWSMLAAARLLHARDALLAGKGYEPTEPKAAQAAADRALQLDPKNGDALGVRAMLNPSTRLTEIDRDLDRALQSEPNNAQLLDWRGEFLMSVGRNREALNALTRAYVLDNATPSLAPELVLAALKTSRFDEAREIMDLVDHGPDAGMRADFVYLHIKSFLYRRDWFGLATYLSGQPERFPPAASAFLRLCRETATALATRDAEKFGPLRASWRAQGAAQPDDAVQFLTALEDDDGALAVVQAAVDSRRNDAFLTDPQWEALLVPDLIPLRRDPRILTLLAGWGLSDYWRTTNHSPDFMR